MALRELSTGASPQSRLVRRQPALLASVALVALGFGYVVLRAGLPGGPFDTWMTPSDLWGTYLASVQLVHGHLSAAYAAYPGILVLFAPAAALGSALHLEVGPNFAAFSAPTGWLLMGPLELAVGCVPLFAADAWAERFTVATRRRYVLALAQAAVLADLTVKWGHPEDALAVGLALYAALEADARRWKRCGWLLGVAVAVQPLALLALPALATAAALAGRRPLGQLALRAVVPGALLLVPALIVDWHQLTYWLVHQPNYPYLNHVTPLTSWSRTVRYGRYDAVEGGPTRLVALAVVAVLGVVMVRWRSRGPYLLFAIAVAMWCRVVFESSLDGYYIWPVLALALLLAARLGWIPLLWAIALALFCTWLSNAHWAGVWGWWSLLVGTLALLVVAVWPGWAPAGAGEALDREPDQVGEVAVHAEGGQP